MGKNPIIVVSDDDDDDWAAMAESSNGAHVNQLANGSASGSNVSMLARDDIKQKLSEIDAEVSSVS